MNLSSIYIGAALFFLSLGLEASEKYKFDCSPYDVMPSFRIKGEYETNLKQVSMGFVHSYTPFGEHPELSGCRVPWYEKFILKGEVDAKFLRHAHEYDEGCMFRLEIPKTSGEGRMWVYRSDKVSEKSKPVSANCVVTKSR